MSAPALRVFEHHFFVYKRTWRANAFSSFLAPVLFLTAMGVGLGSLIKSGSQAASLGGLSYLDFVGPGLLAASAMQMAAGESTFPILGHIKWQKTYHSMLASPVGIRDIVIGQFTWVAFRLTLGAAAYLIVLTLFGIPRSPLAILALPAAVLCGLAYAAPIAAFSAIQENDQGLLMVFRLGIMPMFLFSGTFVPVSQLPAALHPVAWFVPLWHGVELTRGLVLGRLGLVRGLEHTAYLLVWLVVGIALADRAFWRRLEP